MSDKNIYDNLEFDDDIDFDGLDESDEEFSDKISDAEMEMDSNAEFKNEELIVEPVDKNSTSCEEESFDTEEDYKFDEDSFTPTEEKITYSTSNIDSEKNMSPSVCSKKEKSDKFLKCICVTNAALSFAMLGLLSLGIYFGHNYVSNIKDDLVEKNTEIDELKGKNSELEAEYLEAMNMFEKEAEKENEIPLIETDQGKIIHYDSHVGYAWTPVLTGIKQNTYKKENFTVDDRYRMSYIENGEESSYFGIDVSSYQGDIDWQLVKEDGVGFAFLRIGYRGYGQEGKLCPDEYFVQNYDAAHDAGIDLGVYFFSQAATVEEAVEEADYVLSLLEDRNLEYPIVFDWETVVTGDPEDIPRTEDVMPQTLTLSAIAFCETIKDAGYDSMIYTNKKLATIKYDLRQLSDYPVWLAYYDTELNYCYDFDIWQYGTGEVDGIDGEVDVNIAMIK